MKAISLKPIKAESLKDVFVSRFEELILSGQISIGEKLPPERELALKLGVSRPVVHEGIIDLAAKGLVIIKPRVGTIVSDYRKQGSLALLASLSNYHKGKLEPHLFKSLLDMRRLFELESARLAARNRSKKHLEELKGIIDEESKTLHTDIDRIVELDFSFHHLIALATGNLVYPLIMNSFRQVYTNLTGEFFSDRSVVPFVFGLHAALADAVEKQDENLSAKKMDQLLTHGEEQLKRFLKNNGRKKDSRKKEEQI